MVVVVVLVADECQGQSQGCAEQGPGGYEGPGGLAVAGTEDGPGWQGQRELVQRAEYLKTGFYRDGFHENQSWSKPVLRHPFHLPRKWLQTPAVVEL